MRIIKFTALWCADCIVMRSYWREISEKYPDLVIEEFDFDDNPEIAAEHSVKKVPHIIIFSESGQELHRLEGMQNKNDLMKLIEGYLDK